MKITPVFHNLSTGIQIGIGVMATMVMGAFSIVFAANWGSIPMVNSGEPLTKNAWNDVVTQLNSIAGAVNVDGTHLASTLPTASNHLATKGYVDAASGGQTQYLGTTASSYNGNLGGFHGANAKCQASYPGSHMCSVREIISSDRASALSGSAWVRFENYATVGSSGFFDGKYSNSSAGGDCLGWVASNSTYYGLQIGFSGQQLLSSTCDASLPIHCCK